MQEEYEEILKAQKKIDDEIEIINYIVDCAVDHGGDQGGAYLSCGESLCEAIQEWLAFKNLCDEYTVACSLTGNYDRDYKIVKKTKG